MAKGRLKLPSEVEVVLRKNGLDVSDVHDAQFLPPRMYGPQMVATGKKVAFNVTQCKNGHGVRSKRGVCLVCSPGHLSFSARKSLAGNFYILTSSFSGLTKVGFTAGDVTTRVRQLNKDVYAGTFDWQIFFVAHHHKAGEIEIEVNRALEEHRTTVSYFRGTLETRTREVFRCDPFTALTCLTEALRSRPDGERAF